MLTLLAFYKRNGRCARSKGSARDEDRAATLEYRASCGAQVNEFHPRDKLRMDLFFSLQTALSEIRTISEKNSSLLSAGCPCPRITPNSAVVIIKIEWHHMVPFIRPLNTVLSSPKWQMKRPVEMFLRLSVN